MTRPRGSSNLSPVLKSSSMTPRWTRDDGWVSGSTKARAQPECHRGVFELKTVTVRAALQWEGRETRPLGVSDAAHEDYTARVMRCICGAVTSRGPHVDHERIRGERV